MKHRQSFSYARKLAAIALEIGAIKLNPETPFTWASGYRMPVYNDNRLLLGNASHRLLVARGFRAILDQERIAIDAVAGTATAGIPHATTLADLLKTPLVYVRAEPKAHGMRNQVEGILKKNQNLVVVEDLISTGASALKTVEALRRAGAAIRHCLCIFNYGFETSEALFQQANCRLHSLLSFSVLLQYAAETRTVTQEQAALLRRWRQNPFGWGDQNGFPKTNRSTH
ncbi:MAG: orotate phosphoribosyltransferase [Nitrospinales bacterium]